MKTNRSVIKRHFVFAVTVLALVGLVISGSSQAADFPEKGKPIMLIVPFGPGGSTDVAARNLAPYLEEALGTTVEVVDKPGAGSQVGITYALTQKPDGYTIFYANIPGPQTMWLNPERKTVFKSKKDFTFLGLQLKDPGAIAVQYDGPYKNLNDLISAAKANPGKLIAATTGLLSDDHLAIIDVEKQAGVKFAIVHFDSNPERDMNLMSGKIAASFGNCGSFYAPMMNKKVRIIAAMDDQRWSKLPDIPTAEEQGVKTYQASARGLYAPPGMKPEVQKILADAIKKAVSNPEHQKKMDAAGFPVRYYSPAEHEAYWDRVTAWVTPVFTEAYKDSKK
ncbi:MAG: tripartite tricarboxylate transporter substrate binding protein [Pseudomonadota bacterium]